MAYVPDNAGLKQSTRPLSMCAGGRHRRRVDHGHRRGASISLQVPHDERNDMPLQKNM
ncbi:MAG TPA: hypothetical protein DEF41_11270 [Desulfovibrio sp.]|uniref:Uncharacterized protein n=1 Tax=Nitratidesulfovibrio vulgaris (strain ATCC 29579 / DSM 644 / CCUG 34227 / NCIMB 8303 / VKM B-1760 / Hildenborough) TaxID=882 RepID=Q729Y3_NITV2|nr:hypothetical protein DVU_2214 [Nitratidesulfovibrio vulgaris str. Hildenborough]HBW16683.1 hypothetical protein [Desulfovibrio sp.]